MKTFGFEMVKREFVFCPLFLLCFFWSFRAYCASSTLRISINRAARSSRVSKLFCRDIFLNPSALRASRPVSFARVSRSPAPRRAVPPGRAVSPGSVVIDFVRKSRGENFSERMGTGWIGKVESSFKNWKPEEVRDFLGFMTSRTDRENTVERLKSLSHFSLSGYGSFRGKVSFFERYMGEKAVTGRLRRSLGGFFTRKSLDRLVETAKLLEPYVGRETLGKIMEKSPEKFSRINFLELQGILNHAEPRVGKKILGEIMGKDFFGFLESFGYRYKSAEEVFNNLVELENSWKKTQWEINEFFFNHPELSGKGFDNFLWSG